MIHVYTIAYNEEVFIPYFLRHYSFADKVIVYDNASTDRTREIVRACPYAELRHYHTKSMTDELAMIYLKGNAWKKDRSPDWVITCDVDELVYHPDIKAYLATLKQAGVSIPVPVGFEMISDSPPTGGGQAWEEIKTGYPCKSCKSCVLDPSNVEDMAYTVGCHTSTPVTTGTILDPSELKLLHYHTLGFDYMTRRYAERRPRRMENAIMRNWYQQQNIQVKLDTYKPLVYEVV